MLQVHYYTPQFHGWVQGTEDVLVAAMTADRSGSGDALVAGEAIDGEGFGVNTHTRVRAHTRARAHTYTLPTAQENPAACKAPPKIVRPCTKARLSRS